MNKQLWTIIVVFITALFDSCIYGHKTINGMEIFCTTETGIWTPESDRAEYFEGYFDKKYISTTGVVFSEGFKDTVKLKVNSKYHYVGIVKDSSYKVRFDNRVEISHNYSDTICIELEIVGSRCKYSFNLDKEFRFIYLRFNDSNNLSVEYSSFIRYNCCL